MRKLRHVAVVVALVFGAGVVSEGKVSALSTPTFSWKVTRLTPSARIAPSRVWSTNSRGAVRWTATGTGCSKRSNRIVTKRSGSCRVTVTVNATSRYRKITRTKRFAVVASPTTTVPATCAAGGTCAVGDIGPGGGVVFFVSSTPFTSAAACGTSCRYLEAAPAGWSTSPASGCAVAGTASTDPKCGWSANTAAAVGTSTALGAGFANTTAMVTLNNTAGHSATAARAYNGGGKTDWFVPSFVELNELCKYARNQVTGDRTVECTNAGSLRVGFSADYYWSSSEDATLVHVQPFDRGTLSISAGRGTQQCLRPIRAF